MMVVVVVQWFVVEVCVVIAGVLALVVDFIEVMMTSAPDLANCTPPLPLDSKTVWDRDIWSKTVLLKYQNHKYNSFFCISMGNFQSIGPLGRCFL